MKVLLFEVEFYHEMMLGEDVYIGIMIEGENTALSLSRSNQKMSIANDPNIIKHVATLFTSEDEKITIDDNNATKNYTRIKIIEVNEGDPILGLIEKFQNLITQEKTVREEFLSHFHDGVLSSKYDDAVDIELEEHEDYEEGDLDIIEFDGDE